jgi:hypothetical protein
MLAAELRKYFIFFGYSLADENGIGRNRAKDM